MKLRTLLALGALLVAAATPATLQAQRIVNSSGRTWYGQGPFYPSYVPSTTYLGSGGYRSGGATFYFGPGGGYYGSFPAITVTADSIPDPLAQLTTQPRPSESDSIAPAGILTGRGDRSIDVGKP